MNQCITRRQFLATLSALAAAVALPSVARAAAGKRPNILFIYGDDWAYPWASCLGDPVVKTPTFDRLAREGVLFQNAYSAAPSCSPSRAAVLTGQWHWRLKDGANLRGYIAKSIDIYPDLLEAAGYFVGLTGKGYGPGHNGDRPRNPAGPAFPNFAKFLEARPKDKPFCFWFGSTNPHRGYKWESGVQSGMDPAKVKVPGFFPDTEVVRKDICDYLLEVQLLDQQAAELIAALEAAGELDNTIIVMTGDNGMPFPRCKGGVYEFGTHQPLAIRWGARVKGGRVVDDFVSFTDFAPTYLEAAGLPVPPDVTGRSLLPILLSDKSGQVEPARDHVLCGMETHVPCRRLDNGVLAGYPVRALHTKDYHLILNYFPERWPAGDPNGFDQPGANPADYDKLANVTYTAYADCDGGPTKAWMITHRDEPEVKPFVERAFGKRPRLELYDLKKDPYQLRNVAADPAYAEVAKKLEEQLMAELRATKDPRALGRPEILDELNVATTPEGPMKGGPAKNAQGKQKKEAKAQGEGKKAPRERKKKKN